MSLLVPLAAQLCPTQILARMASSAQHPPHHVQACCGGQQIAAADKARSSCGGPQSRGRGGWVGGWVGGGSRQSVRLPRAGNPSNPSDSDCRGEPAIRCREPAIRAIRVAPIAAANRQSVRLPRAGNPKPSMSSPAGRALSGSR